MVSVMKTRTEHNSSISIAHLLINHSFPFFIWRVKCNTFSQKNIINKITFYIVGAIRFHLKDSNQKDGKATESNLLLIIWRSYEKCICVTIFLNWNCKHIIFGSMCRLARFTFYLSTIVANYSSNKCMLHCWISDGIVRKSELYLTERSNECVKSDNNNNKWSLNANKQ